MINFFKQFIKVGGTGKEQLIPVLCAMLKLSEEEKKVVVEFAKGKLLVFRIISS